MRKGFVIFILSSFVSQLAHSYDPVLAYRKLDKDYTLYEARAFAHAGPDEEKERRKTPLGISKKYDEAILPKATAWKSMEVLQKRFEAMRDAKFLVWRQRPEVLRRASWLYPDDGCFARAALANRNLFRWFHPVPNKVFAFGNLRVKTSNSPRGAVGWWYHVAPIVEVKKVKYVLDPAIEPSRPLILKEWLSRMGVPEKIKVAICGSGTYSPGDNCEKETEGLELRAERAQQYYLTKEWQRLVRLGRESEL